MNKGVKDLRDYFEQMAIHHMKRCIEFSTQANRRQEEWSKAEICWHAVEMADATLKHESEGAK